MIEFLQHFLGFFKFALRLADGLLRFAERFGVVRFLLRARLILASAEMLDFLARVFDFGEAERC